MHKRIILLFVACCLLLTAGCGFHLRDNTSLPTEFKSMLLESGDPYSSLVRAVRQQLRLNDVHILTEDQATTEIPTLRILGSTNDKNTVSIYRNGSTAENQMVLTVNAQVVIPHQGIYPVDVKVMRSFFDNPREALAKDAEQDLLVKEMEELAAEQLMIKLKTIAVPSTVQTH